MTNEKLTMSNGEAKEILIKNAQQMKANPNVIVDERLYIAFDMGVKVLEQTELNPSYNSVKTELKPRTNLAETSQDTISREALRQKLQDHHDFFVNAFGSFKNMTYINKARVDEIDNCIAMVVNAPPVTPTRPKGKWIDSNLPQEKYVCSECGGACWYYDYEGSVAKSKYCPNCGADMRGEK